MKKIVAIASGFDLSTTALSCGVRSVDGQEGFVSVPMRGACEWNGQPGFDLVFVPGMMLNAMGALREKGWSFGERGALSFSVRQHDVVLLDEHDVPLMPALSWQCNVAEREVAILNAIPGVRDIVGAVESRFILPKLIWVLRNYPGIAERVTTVMATGDYITCCLTGCYSLSTSDAVSNGRLNQKSKALAINALTVAAHRCGVINPGSFAHLFPAPEQSGELVGAVNPNFVPPGSKEWRAVARILQGWEVVSGLGDNHAGAVGCGLDDFKTIVISAGTSGTVVRKCRLNQSLAGKASCFEYYDDRLLLMMLADCADWYVKFAYWYCGCVGGESPDLARLDGLAMIVPPHKLKFWPAEKRKMVLARKRPLNPGPELVASAQFSIAVELLMRANMMLEEVKGRSARVNRFVLTGGLCRSQFFREVLVAGIGALTNARVFVSDRKGPLAFQAATSGALINAMVGSGRHLNLASAIAELCPLKPVEQIWLARSESLSRSIVNTPSIWRAD